MGELFSFFFFTFSFVEISVVLSLFVSSLPLLTLFLVRRFEQEPFPLYPGEKLVGGKVSPLQVVAPNAALRLRAIRDFVDDHSKIKHVAGDEWLFEGMVFFLVFFFSPFLRVLLKLCYVRTRHILPPC